MSRVAIMGSGSWGTAFSMVLADAGSQVRFLMGRINLGGFDVLMTQSVFGGG